jgi:hypothetical protein
VFGPDEDDESSEDDGHGHHVEIKWYDKLIICDSHTGFLFFDAYVTVLSLLSVYYYGAIAGFRYSTLDAYDKTNTNIQMFLEITFVLHMF